MDTDRVVSFLEEAGISKATRTDPEVRATFTLYGVYTLLSANDEVATDHVASAIDRVFKWSHTNKKDSMTFLIKNGVEDALRCIESPTARKELFDWWHGGGGPQILHPLFDIESLFSVKFDSAEDPLHKAAWARLTTALDSGDEEDIMSLMPNNPDGKNYVEDSMDITDEVLQRAKTISDTQAAEIFSANVLKGRFPEETDSYALGYEDASIGTAELHTLTNHPLPLFLMGGRFALVIEDRSGSGLLNEMLEIAKGQWKVVPPGKTVVGETADDAVAKILVDLNEKRGDRKTSTVQRGQETMQRIREMNA